MDYSKKTRNELIAICKEKNIKGYSAKKKEEIVALLTEKTAILDTPDEKQPESFDEKELDPTSLPTQIHATHKKDMGQYFTVSENLQQFVFDKVKHKLSRLLEPSFGAGHLLMKFKEYDENYPMTCYELDTQIKPAIVFNEHQTPIYADFTQQKNIGTFKTIVGNPPYVKQKTGNLYIKFIEQCYEVLDEDGEMIFIVPSDFIKLTRAASIIDKMTKQGSFTDFLFPHNEKLFEGASVDVVVFRYERGYMNHTARVNEKEMFCNVNKGIITFSDSEVSGTPIDTLFHVYVGLVSGKDEVYRAPFGNIELLTDKDKVEPYIFTDTFPTTHTQINTHLLLYKQVLLGRKIKKFSEKNWFEWGAPRNLSSIRKYWGEPCIYIRNMTRQKEVAFMGTVQYFGGSLLCLVPKTKMDPTVMDPIVRHINSPEFQRDYLYAGRFKIGHKQISNAILPH